MKNSKLLRILVFYLIAIAVSNLFRFDIVDLQQLIEINEPLELLLFSPFESIGVIIGALIALKLLKKKRTTRHSLFGTSKTLSVIMVIIPVALLVIFGVDNTLNEPAHSYGLWAGAGTLIYCLFEEIGWRGYLQDELSSLKEWQSTLLVGFLWYLWHLQFLINTAIIDNAIFLAILIAGSWGLAKVMKFTKSILAVTAFHMIINILITNSLIKNGLPQNHKIWILGIAVTTFILILIWWDKKPAKSV